MKRIISLILAFALCLSINVTNVYAANNPFTDVNDYDYFYEPVMWAVENGITTGMGEGSSIFAPNDICTRGQMITFLYRCAGKPKVDKVNNPFNDVNSDDFFYEPVMWAINNNLTTGTSPTTFEPNRDCTRGEVVTFLHRFAGNPSVDNVKNPFTDVYSDDFFYKPVLWAVENKITTGMGEGASIFAPYEPCTRGQIVTFLYRFTNNQSNTNEKGISVGNVKAKAGAAEVVVPVTVYENPGILGMTLKLEYDEDVMTLIKATNGEALDVLTFTTAKQLKSGCNFVWDGQEISEEDIKDGVIMYLTFSVKGNAAKGTYKISLEAKEIINNDLEILDLPIKSGNLVIE